MAGLTKHESVLKDAELVSKLTTGISPEIFKGDVSPPKFKIPRALSDINRKYKDFDVDALTTLKKNVQDMDIYDEKDRQLLNDVEDAIQRYIDDYQEFKKLNSEQIRQISMRKAELELEHETHQLKLMAKDAEAKLESKYDWKSKWRHLFIKSLGTALFISLLLFVGWLVKNYEWAELPYSSLFKTVVPLPKL